jgi:TBC1 domain family member 10
VIATSSQGHSGPLSPIESASEKQSIRPSTDTDAASISSDYRSFLAANPSAPGRQNSLRTKLSLPNLRRHKSKQDETSSLGSGSQITEIDTVQVKDTDFELVRPNLPFISTRNSEDVCRDGSLEPPLSAIPPGSPALSTFSNRSVNGASDSASRNSPRTEPLSPLKFSQETEQLIDAHRQRELRWVSLMSSVLPAQARKSKKVKKLLLEGVPASVRYLVWSHVTNGRERMVAGVYAQLCSRGRVPASDSIEADIQRSLRDHPPLQGRESPVLTVLQAYLNMVPDLQYSIGAYQQR